MMVAMRRAICLLVLTLTACSTVPSPSELPRATDTVAPTIAPSPTPVPSPSLLAGQLVGYFVYSAGFCSWLLITGEEIFELRLEHRYDGFHIPPETQLGQAVIRDRDGTVVAGDGDRIGVNGVVDHVKGGFCRYERRPIVRKAVIVDVEPRAPFTLAESKRGVRYPLQIYTHCGLKPVQLNGVAYWDFEGPTGAIAPEGFDDPYDVGIVIFHDETHATYTSSGGVSVDLREVSWPEPDPSIAPCPL
jgi:hypothetical protein